MASNILLGMAKDAVAPTIVSSVREIAPSFAQRAAESLFPQVESIVNLVADLVGIV